MLLLRGRAGCQQALGGNFSAPLLFGSHQAEVLNSLFHITCVKAAGAQQP